MSFASYFIKGKIFIPHIVFVPFSLVMLIKLLLYLISISHLIDLENEFTNIKLGRVSKRFTKFITENSNFFQNSYFLKLSLFPNFFFEGSKRSDSFGNITIDQD